MEPEALYTYGSFTCQPSPSMIAEFLSKIWHSHSLKETFTGVCSIHAECLESLDLLCLAIYE